jgi:hypothetical protein
MLGHSTKEVPGEVYAPEGRSNGKKKSMLVDKIQLVKAP